MNTATESAALASLIAAFCAANPDEGRAIFERAIAAAPTTAKADDTRLLCEYHCNPAFKTALQSHVAGVNGL
jgi:hypothetical protein